MATLSSLWDLTRDAGPRQGGTKTLLGSELRQHHIL